jgi:hypothetical protein
MKPGKAAGRRSVNGGTSITTAGIATEIGMTMTTIVTTTTIETEAGTVDETGERRKKQQKNNHDLDRQLSNSTILRTAIRQDSAAGIDKSAYETFPGLG